MEKEHSVKFILERIFQRTKKYTKISNKVAVKVLEKDKIKEGDSLERVNREINLLKILKNENVIQLFEVSHYLNRNSKTTT